MNNNNLGNALIAGAASFFQPNGEKQQSLFSTVSPPKQNGPTAKGKKKLEQRAFQS